MWAAIFGKGIEIGSLAMADVKWQAKINFMIAVLMCRIDYSSLVLETFKRKFLIMDVCGIGSMSPAF